ncbi:MAG: hypothetical protein K0R55_247 [Sporomusa sp.]|nr:hypothetical protein [Sporomusa sp.]
MQQRAKHLILSDYYDHINLSELQYSALKTLTNAQTHKDVHWYLWNSGVIESTLDYISNEIKSLRKRNRREM